MSLSPLEETEIIIRLLEDIDSNFSSIRANLREMKSKISRLSKKQKLLVKNVSPWINFFEIESKKEFSPLSEMNLTSLNFREIVDSPVALRIDIPKNPFTEAGSSEILKKSILKYQPKDSTHNSNFNEMLKPVNSLDNANETINLSETENEIKPFNISDLPRIFQDEDDIASIYNFIAEKGIISKEKVLERFNNLPNEKLDIFIRLLCRKNFVKQTNGMLTAKKE